MRQDPGSRYRIRHAGSLVEVEAPAHGAKNAATLYVDGEEADRQSVGFGEKATLTEGDLTVEVQWWWTDKVGSCHMVETLPADDGDETPVIERTPLDPPEGTRAARLAELQRAHPVAYALRHVVIAAGQIAFTVLGLGVLLGALLPNIDLSFLPTVDLPEVSLPDLPWPEIPWPDLPDIPVPGWITAILESKKWWLPIVIAIFVAVSELERRKKKTAARGERERGADPEGSA